MKRNHCWPDEPPHPTPPPPPAPCHMPRTVDCPPPVPFGPDRGAPEPTVASCATGAISAISGMPGGAPLADGCALRPADAALLRSSCDAAEGAWERCEAPAPSPRPGTSAPESRLAQLLAAVGEGAQGRGSWARRTCSDARRALKRALDELLGGREKRPLRPPVAARARPVPF